MSIFSKQQQKPVYDLHKVEPTHKKFNLFDSLKEFWLSNQNGIVLLIIAVCIMILLVMIGYATVTGHFHMFNLHMFGTEANIYEHLVDVV